MGFDIATWTEELAAGGALSTEELTQVRSILGKDAVKKRVEEGVLRQSDYSRNMNDLKKKEDAAKALIQANTEWKQNAEAELAKAQNDLQAERTSKAQYQAELDRIAEEYGLDPAVLKARLNAQNPPPPATTTVKPAEVPPPFKKEELDAMKLSVAQGPQLTAHLLDLQAEHQELFGKPLRDAQKIVKTAMEENLPLRKVWERDYKVDERKAEIAEAQRAENEKRIREDERNKVISELSVPHQRPNTPQSVVFAKATPSSAPGTSSSVQAAVAAFTAGKYRGASTP